MTMTRNVFAAALLATCAAAPVGGGITFVGLPPSVTVVSASMSPISAHKPLSCSAAGQTVMCPLNESQVGGTPTTARR